MWQAMVNGVSKVSGMFVCKAKIDVCPTCKSPLETICVNCLKGNMTPPPGVEITNNTGIINDTEVHNGGYVNQVFQQSNDTETHPIVPTDGNGGETINGSQGTGNTGDISDFPPASNNSSNQVFQQSNDTETHPIVPTGGETVDGLQSTRNTGEISDVPPATNNSSNQIEFAVQSAENSTDGFEIPVPTANVALEDISQYLQNRLNTLNLVLGEETTDNLPLQMNRDQHNFRILVEEAIIHSQSTINLLNELELLRKRIASSPPATPAPPNKIRRLNDKI